MIELTNLILKLLPHPCVTSVWLMLCTRAGGTGGARDLVLRNTFAYPKEVLTSQVLLAQTKYMSTLIIWLLHCTLIAAIIYIMG